MNSGHNSSNFTTIPGGLAGLIKANSVQLSWGLDWAWQKLKNARFVVAFCRNFEDDAFIDSGFQYLGKGDIHTGYLVHKSKL